MVLLYKVFVLEIFNVDNGAHFVITGQLHHILDGAALAGLVALGHLVHFQPVATAFLRKEKHGMVGRSYEQVFYPVLFPGAAANGAPATAFLNTIFRSRSALY